MCSYNPTNDEFISNNKWIDRETHVRASPYDYVTYNWDSMWNFDDWCQKQLKLFFFDIIFKTAFIQPPCGGMWYSYHIKETMTLFI